MNTFEFKVVENATFDVKKLIDFSWQFVNLVVRLKYLFTKNVRSSMVETYFFHQEKSIILILLLIE